MSDGRGRVLLVGAGPGAPDLITVRGLECLRRAEVVLYDDLADRSLLEEAPAAAERIWVGKQSPGAVTTQEQICRLLVERAGGGRMVVRLKGGDPFVFGRGGEEAEALVAAGIPFEVVPGVSAAVAVPAFAGIPLTQRHVADSFEVSTGHAPEEQHGRTAVVLMVVKRLADNVARLRRGGYDGALPAALIERGTQAGQRTVVATLDTIVDAATDIEPPAVLVVGEVVSLRERLSWFERRPLFGLRVLVTRGRAQGAETCRALEALGAATVAMPTIALRPADPEPLRAAVARLAARGYELVIFTSANAVDPVQRAVAGAGLDARVFAGAALCAVGPGTATALATIGLRADLVAADHRAEGILELLGAERVAGKRVLLPRAAAARELLPDQLAERGAQVDVVPVYENCPPSAEETAAGLAELRAGRVDVLTFTSASTVEGLAALLGAELRPLCAGRIVAAIGPVTRDACARLGLEVQVTPRESTVAAMVEAIAAHVATVARGGRGIK
jgi:uroporphyrinogen III methyltransferase / synthase